MPKERLQNSRRTEVKIAELSDVAQPGRAQVGQGKMETLAVSIYLHHSTVGMQMDVCQAAAVQHFKRLCVIKARFAFQLTSCKQ